VHVIGEFREKLAVRRAIESLRDSGVHPDDLDLFSEEPVELPKHVLDRPSHMSLVAVAGAILVGTLATGFVYWAQHNYPLITGGMPIFSPWATGVITYELTMLGAVISTFAWFLWESGLIRKRDRSAPVPEVAPESICLRVRCEREQAVSMIDTMRRAGAIAVERRGEA
jgi:ActD protein